MTCDGEQRKKKQRNKQKPVVTKGLQHQAAVLLEDKNTVIGPIVFYSITSTLTHL